MAYVSFIKYKACDGIKLTFVEKDVKLGICLLYFYQNNYLLRKFSGCHFTLEI